MLQTMFHLWEFAYLTVYGKDLLSWKIVDNIRSYNKLF